MNNYYGIFSSYSPGRGCIDILVMHGDFLMDELNKINEIVQEWIQKQKMKEFTKLKNYEEDLWVTL